MKIVLIESLGIRKELLNSYIMPLREQGHVFECFERDTDIEKQKERLKDADVLMIANMPLKQEVLNACEKLKFIDVAFTGVDHIPVAAAKERHIAVSNASGYSNESVAELVLGVTLSLLRRVMIVDKNTRTGKTVDGNVVLAVNALLMQLFTLYSYFMDGFAYAGEALTGKYIGAKDNQS